MITVSLVTFLVECSVSITRMNKFLNHEDLDPNSVKWSTNPAILGEATILVQNASYGWVKSGDSILKNINMRVDPGTLVSIVGQVGAGKSSFLMALLGEMDKLSTRLGNDRGAPNRMLKLAFCIHG